MFMGVGEFRQGGGSWLWLKCPDDFASRFVALGRIGVQVHYPGAGRATINRWLDECGKDELIAKRARYVRDAIEERSKWPKLYFLDALARLGNVGRAVEEAGITKPTVYQWRATDTGFAKAWSCALLLNRDPTLARRAAHHLRARQNGGHMVSPASDWQWWIGKRKVPAAELVQEAIKRGFDANLTTLPEADLGLRRP